MTNSLTVLMPVHNLGRYVGAAIESVLGQTIQDFEFLIIDDGSNDNSLEEISKLRDARLRVIRRQKAGLGATLQLGLEICRTPFLARMDADDLVTPTRFEKQLAFLERNRTVGAVGTQFTYFIDDQIPVWSPSLPITSDKIIYLLKRGSLALVHASLMFRTEALRACGGYRIAGSGEDWDMFLRLGEVSELANLDEQLYWWRLHPGNISVSKIKLEQLGIRYAIDCACLRANRLREPSFQEYVKTRSHRSATAVAGELKSRSLFHYRQGLCHIARKQRVKGYFELALASTLAPDRLVCRLRREFGSQSR